jgi:hypothetical protein
MNSRFTIDIKDIRRRVSAHSLFRSIKTLRVQSDNCSNCGSNGDYGDPSIRGNHPTSARLAVNQIQ